MLNPTQEGLAARSQANPTTKNLDKNMKMTEQGNRNKNNNPHSLARATQYQMQKKMQAPTPSPQSPKHNMNKKHPLKQKISTKI